jgi:hypothetical protein
VSSAEPPLTRRLAGWFCALEWRHRESNPGPPACKSPTADRVGLHIARTEVPECAPLPIHWTLLLARPWHERTSFIQQVLAPERGPALYCRRTRLACRRAASCSFWSSPGIPEAHLTVPLSTCGRAEPGGSRARAVHRGTATARAFWRMPTRTCRGNFALGSHVDERSCRALVLLVSGGLVRHRSCGFSLQFN